MIFRSAKIPYTIKTAIKIDNIEIEKVHSINFLGVIIDERLNLTDHVILGQISMYIVQSYLPKIELCHITTLFCNISIGIVLVSQKPVQIIEDYYIYNYKRKRYDF